MPSALANASTLVERHLVVVGLRVAQLGAASRNECQRGLGAEDGVATSLSLLLSEAVDLEHPGNVFAVGIAYLHHCLVVVEVVILLSEGEPALREVVDIHRNVLLVGTEGIVVEHAVAEHGVLLLQCQQVGFGLGGLNLVEQRLHRGYAFTLAAGCRSSSQTN